MSIYNLEEVKSFPEFVPHELREFYSLTWCKPRSGIPKRMVLAAERLVTDSSMEGLYETLTNQGANGADWKHILNSMVWPTLHTDKKKNLDKTAGREYKKHLEKALKQSVDLYESVSELLELANSNADTCPSDYQLSNAWSLFKQAGLNSRLSEVPYRFEHYILEEGELPAIDSFDRKYFPDAADIVATIYAALDRINEQTNAPPFDATLISNKTSFRDNLRLFVDEVSNWNDENGTWNEHSPLLLREADYVTWVNVALSPNIPITRSQVNEALRGIRDHFSDKSFLLK